MKCGKEIVARLTAAKEALKSKGYECPSVEIGLKVMKDYGPVWWVSIHLSSPQNWIGFSNSTQDTLAEALTAIDEAVPTIPDKHEEDAAYRAALSKLSPRERALMRERAGLPPVWDKEVEP